MIVRNWIELAIIITIIIAGVTIKSITTRKVRQSNGFVGINKSNPGKGWKMK